MFAPRSGTQPWDRRRGYLHFLSSQTAFEANSLSGNAGKSNVHMQIAAATLVSRLISFSQRARQENCARKVFPCRKYNAAVEFLTTNILF